MTAVPAITLDVDWAPDFAIDYAAQALLEAGIRAAWFITHDSPAVRRLKAYPEFFELGIHPNFLPGSSHGRSESEVLEYCMDLVPNAKLVRTHGLVQSSNLLQKIVLETDVSVDLSLFLPHARNVEAVTYHWGDGVDLVRLPYIWEDDFETVRPNSDWDLGSMISQGQGIAVFDFHPIHIYLNSNSLMPYREVRKLGQIAMLTASQVESVVCDGIGTRDAFHSAIEKMRGMSVAPLSELALAKPR